ncbi:MAG: glutathione S-transferase N-terminal domain-containing protein [Burkholderiaceae bacterium]|jgi:glutathione S-transferase|nr:glutathione S-transferase N-terminal domain-containing protein [Burkholderiaceae bacterium]
MRLIGTLTSPYVRKVRVVLAEKKLDCQLVLESPWQVGASVAAANPLGKVPCLVLDGQDAVFDSRVIVEYLDTLSPVCSLLPPMGRQRMEVKTWEALADGLLDAATAARLERTWAGRAESERSAAWIERQMSKVDAALTAMSAGLGGKPWCSAGARLSLADVAVGCALGYLDFRFPALDWRGRHPNLVPLMSRLMQRPSFAETAPRE